MATVGFDQFLPMILPYAPGLPIMSAEHAIRLAAIEFCERTRCWRHLVDVAFDAANHQAVVAPAYATIHQFEFAVFQGENVDRCPLEPTQYSEIAPKGLTLYEGSAPKHITQTAPGLVTIFPFAPGTVSLSLFLKPRHGQDFANVANTAPLEDFLNQLPDFMLTQWGEAIAAGALARVLVMPGKEWTNPALAALRAAQFENACNSHFSHNVAGQQRARVRTKPHYF